VLAVWPDIRAAAAGPRGARYRIRVDRKSFAWADWPLNEKARRRQVELLGRFPENLWETARDEQ
jgi:hypothetical protein